MIMKSMENATTRDNSTEAHSSKPLKPTNTWKHAQARTAQRQPVTSYSSSETSLKA